MQKKHKTSPSNRGSTSKKSYESKVESGRERGIRQSQSGSKYDKQVSDYAQKKGFETDFSGRQASGSDQGLGGKSGASQEFDRRQRIEGGTTTAEDRRQMESIADITGKDPYKKEEKYDAKEEFWDETNNRWDIRKARQNIPFFQQMTGRKIAQITADGTIIFADQLGGTMRFMKLMDKLNALGSEYTGFQPGKALTEGGMGDQGKAALYNKLKDMSTGEFQDFLNRKGNLDRIMEFAGQGAGGGPSPDFDMNKLKSGGREYLMSLLEGTGGEDFQMLKLKNSSDKRDRQKYYELNPHLLQTSGGLEEAARAGISYVPGYGPVEKPEGPGFESQGIAGIGGGGGALPPTDPTTDPTKVPDYVLKQQYMPNFTPDYSGGAEQMHIAGGYWDPRTQKWIGGGPWGTTGKYQFNQGGIVGISPLLFKNQGGMVNDGGIKSFKKYGY